MKKALAMLLAAVLALSGGVSAWAAEEPEGDHSHIVSDIYFISGEDVIDLTGVTIELDASVDGGAKAGRLHVDKDGETAAELGITVTEDGLYVLHMDSPTLGHVDYGIDPVMVLARMLRSGIDGLTGILQSIDVDSAARGLLDSMMKGSGAVEEQPEPAAPAVPDITIEGDAKALLESCISEPETTHMGGVEYLPNGSEIEIPDGVYEEQTFTFDTDTVCALLDMIYIDGEPAGLGDKFRDAGVDFLFTGDYHDSDTVHLGQIGGSLTSDELSLAAGGSYDQFVTGEGTKTVYSFGASSGTDPETAFVMGAGFTVADGTHEGEPFTAGSIDMDEVVMLTDMDTDEALETLSMSLSALLGDMLAPVMEPFADMMQEAMAEAGLEAPGEPVE